MPTFTIKMLPLGADTGDAEAARRVAEIALAVAQNFLRDELRPLFARQLGELLPFEVEGRVDGAYYADVTIDDTPWTRLWLYLLEVVWHDHRVWHAVQQVYDVAIDQLVPRAPRPVIAVEHDGQPWVVAGRGLVGVGVDQTLDAERLDPGLAKRIEEMVARGYGEDGMSEQVELGAEHQAEIARALRGSVTEVGRAMLQVMRLRSPSAETIDAAIDGADHVVLGKASFAVRTAVARAAGAPEVLAVLRRGLLSTVQAARAVALDGLAQLVGRGVEVAEVRAKVIAALEHGSMPERRTACWLAGDRALSTPDIVLRLAVIVRTDEDPDLVVAALGALTTTDWALLSAEDVDAIERCKGLHREQLGKQAISLGTRVFLFRNGQRRVGQ